MILFINTSKNDLTEIALSIGKRSVAVQQIRTCRSQAEKLLPAIEKLLEANKLKLRDLEGIEAANSGESFTALRIGVATANALAYALGIPASCAAKFGIARHDTFVVIKPAYRALPRITGCA